MQLLGETVLEANRDITALRENEERVRWLASIINSSDDAIVGKTLDGVITSWNRAAVEFSATRRKRRSASPSQS